MARYGSNQAQMMVLQRLFRRYPVFIVSMPVVLGLAAQAVFKNDSEWQEVYVATARVLLDGGDIYAAGHGYLYPPFAALLAVPFVPLPELAARLGWYVVNVLAVVWLLRSAWNLAGGTPLAAARSLDRRDGWAFGLGLLCIGPYILNMLAHQQTDLAIAALLTGGCCITLRGRVVEGALMIGLAAAFKGPPLLFVGYFVFRRHWLAAGLVLAVAIGVNLLPELIAQPRSGTWLGNWLSRVVLPSQSLDVRLGTWNAELYNLYNQSLAGTLQRVANSILVFTSDGLEIVARAVPVAAGLMKAIAGTSMVLMLATSMWSALRGERRAGRGIVEVGLPSRTALEFGTVMILALLISPMSGLAHFVVLAMPIMCLSRIAVWHGHRVATAAMAVAAIGALVINKDLVGGTFYDVVLWSGVPTALAIMLWLADIILLATGEGAPASPAFSGSIFSWRKSYAGAASRVTQ